MTTDANIVIGIEGRIDGGRRIKRTLDDVADSGDKATNSTKRLSREMKATSRTANLLANSLKFFAVGAIASGLTKMTDDFTLLEARIKNSTHNLKEFNEAMQALRKSSAETGAEFGASVEIFQRLSFVRNEIKATVSEMTTFTDNVQKLGVMSGASTQGLNAGLRQLGQALSSEIVRAEEFNSIMENIPAVGRAIADELGVTTGEMRQLVINGKLLSSDVFAAILNQTDQVNEQFNTFPKTIGRALNEFYLKLQLSAGEINKVIGGTQLVIKGFQIAGTVLEALTGLIKGFGNSIKAFFDFVIAGIIDAFNMAARQVERLTNSVIDAINKIKPGEALKHVKFSSDISRKALATAAADAARKEIEAAKKGFESAFEKSAELFTGKQTRQIKVQKKATREISQNYKDIVKSLKKAKEPAASLKQEVLEMKSGTEHFKNSVTDLDRSIQTFGESASDAFTKFITGAMTAREAVASIMRAFASQMAQKASSSLSGLFTSGLSAIAGSLFGGASFESKVAASALKRKPSFATGGELVFGGKGGIDNNVLSLNGMPIANVSRGETATISPSGKNRNKTIVINQTNNFSLGVKETVQSEIIKILPDLQESARAYVKEADARGFS